MYPPPMTSSDSGMSDSASAPVESITRGESILNIFGIAGTEPVARMQ